VVLLKGGQSRAGNRAAASHTGAMGSDARVFDAVCRQAGIIKVDQPMELLDLAAAFSALPLPRGNRVAIITLGGGWGVVTTDLCERFGLQVPPLPPALVARIDALLPPFWSRANPVDVVGTGDFETPMAVMAALLGWDGCDALITLGIVGRRVLQERALDAVLKSDPSYSAEFIAATRSRLEGFERDFIQQTVKMMAHHQKPVAGVRLLSAPDDRSLYPLTGFPHQALFFETPEQAVKSLARMYEYQRFLKRAG
jgi:acyl-CoA synthetase (NDP forming)